MTANHDTWLAAPYFDRDAAAALWEQRTDLLRTVRPKLLAHLADILDCELKTRFEHRDLQGLRAALGEWLDGLRDGELEDRIAVEVGVIAPWDAPL